MKRAHLRILILGMVFSAVFPAVFPAPVSASDVKVKLVNKSKFAIHQMYVSSTKENQWGPDQLGDKTIDNGESFELTGIPVGKYDFKLVDEDGDECVVSAVKVAADEEVRIDDSMLVGCQVATDESKEESEDKD